MRKNFLSALLQEKLCLRSLYKFLLREGDVKDNPFSLASLPKKDQRLPRFLYEKEMDQLFSSLKKDSPIE